MEIIKSLRAYHLALAVLALAAYFSDDLRRVHAYIGYAVGLIILFRLAWSLKPEPLLKLSRFIPSFKNIDGKNILRHPATGKVILLILTISLLGTVATGVALDKGRALGIGESRGEHRKFQREKSFTKEAHELFANTFIVFVVLHGVHLFAYRRRMAKFMLYLDDPK